MRIEIDAAAQAHIDAATDALFRDKLGPAIRDDAKRYAPRATGALAGSIEDHLDGHNLVVTATGGSGGRAYAADVELGHRIVAWGHRTGRSEPPRPFLRPALFQERSG